MARIPEPVLVQIRDFHHGGITAEDCVSCSSPCCAEAGFAILENVLEIYAAYQRGELSRAGYEFPPGLSFRDFVLEYFDVYRYDVPDTVPTQSLVIFHMRSLSPDGHTISIPPMASVAAYCRARRAIFDANTWVNTGCVFLSHGLGDWPVDDNRAERRCILHEPDRGDELGLKPVSCRFHTCNTPRDPRLPTPRQSDDFFAALAAAYPGSVQRFQELVAE